MYSYSIISFLLWSREKLLELERDIYKYLTIFLFRYDMMIGVTSAEAFILLNSVEMELGLETESRNKLVSDLVMK